LSFDFLCRLNLIPSLIRRLSSRLSEIAKSGGTPLVVASKDQVLGTVHLRDIVKGGLRRRFARFRAMGIRTVMITGDSALTASAIALEAGVDDYRQKPGRRTNSSGVRKSNSWVTAWP
jgi:K+-transporting ATPase ATPase B chain